MTLNNSIKLTAGIITCLLTSSCLTTPDYAEKRKESFSSFESFKENQIPNVDIEKVYGLEECIVEGIDKNLDLVAKRLEQQVADKRAFAHLLSALPSMQASSNLTSRDNKGGGISEGIQDGEVSLRPSTSSDKDSSLLTFETSVSSLDFGMALINSQFEKDEKRKAYVNEVTAKKELTFQILQAYWNVASAQYAIEKVEKSLKQNDGMFDKIDGAHKEKTIDKWKYYEDKEELLEAQKKLREFKRSHENHSYRLTMLMGYNPSKKIIVDTSMYAQNNDGKFNTKLYIPAYEDLEKSALHLRPELIEMDIDTHTSHLKERTELLKMFPNVRLFHAYNNSSNSYLYNNDWNEVGVNVIVDFLQIPSRLQNMAAEQRQREVIKLKQFATMINITAQLKIAYNNVPEVLERLDFSQALYDNCKAENTAITEAHSLEQKTEIDVIKSDLELVLKDIQRAVDFGNYNVAMHRLLDIASMPQKDLREYKPFNNVTLQSEADKEGLMHSDSFKDHFKYAKETGVLNLP